MSPLLQLILLFVVLAVMLFGLSLLSRGVLLATVYGMYLAVKIRELLRLIYSVLKIDLGSKGISAIIYISAISPKIGSRLIDRGLSVNVVERRFSRSVGEEMADFRRFVRKEYVMNYTPPDGEELNKRELLLQIRDVRNQLRDRHLTGEITITVVGGVFTLIAGYYSLFELIALTVTVYLILFTVSMFLRTVIVDFLSFKGDLFDETETNPVRHQQPATLRFKWVWNRMLLENESIIHKIVLLSLLKGELPFGYERGKDLIRMVLNSDLEIDEAVDQLVEEQMGSSKDADLVRRLVRRFIGV